MTASASRAVCRERFLMWRVGEGLCPSRNGEWNGFLKRPRHVKWHVPRCRGRRLCRPESVNVKNVVIPSQSADWRGNLGMHPCKKDVHRLPRRFALLCCGAQNFCAVLQRALEILTAATRSPCCFRHRRRTALSLGMTGLCGSSGGAMWASPPTTVYRTRSSSAGRRRRRPLRAVYCQHTQSTPAP